MTSTPPTRDESHLTVPPTPRFAARYDSGASRSASTRRSARISSQHSVRTPSPEPELELSSSSPTQSPRNRSKKHSQFTHTSYTSASALSPASSSSQGSPQRPARSRQLNAQTSISFNMLPTPVKTPRKKYSQPSTSLEGRVLFPNQHAGNQSHDRFSSKGQKHVGFDLNGNSHEPIKVYTDSRDVIPELDISAENPFYVNGAKRRKGAARSQAVNVATKELERNEGMLYIFRGKKMYRKFPTISEDEENGHEANEFTPKAIKPQRLFEIEPSHSMTTDDEEALTEVEFEHEKASKIQDPHMTPKKRSVPMPATPPSTARVTRSRKVVSSPNGNSSDTMSSSPSKPTTMRSFDTWTKTKPGLSERKNKKRAAVNGAEALSVKRQK